MISCRDGQANLPLRELRKTGDTMTHSARFVKVVEEARSRVREVSVEEVHRRLAEQEPFHLVDVRERQEWEAGRLPGAVHLSKGVIERDVERTIAETNAPIVLYCGGGYRSALAAENLQRMGYTNVASMAGGYRAWEQAQLPTQPPDA